MGISWRRKQYRRGIPGRSDQSNPNTYGAEDEHDKMDSNLANVDRANDALPGPVALLATWSDWKPFTLATVRAAPTTPGVYLFRQATSLVYVGRAGERSGKGLRGRLMIYVSGRAPHSGLGNLALERALQDVDWLRDRLTQLQAGAPLTVQEWSALAVQRAELDVCWASTDAVESVALERAVLDASRGADLWNRLR